MFQYKSPLPVITDSPQYGTLNWGLKPTIIYKTPDDSTFLEDDCNNFKKYSISAGNVQILTPSPSSDDKSRRMSCRMKDKRPRNKQRVYLKSKYFKLVNFRFDIVVPGDDFAERKVICFHLSFLFLLFQNHHQRMTTRIHVLFLLPTALLPDCHMVCCSHFPPTRFPIISVANLLLNLLLHDIHNLIIGLPCSLLLYILSSIIFVIMFLPGCPPYMPIPS